MAERFQTFTSAVIPLAAENVDTDQIVPARYLKVTTKDGLREALFRDWRYDEDGGLKEPLFVMDRVAMLDRQILLVGDNFGAGSSREHAPWALTAWGIRAILSTSFADIFRNNALKNGLLPIVVEAEKHRQLFELVATNPRAELTVDLEAQVIHLPGDEDLPFEVDPFARLMLLNGTDEMGYLLGKLPAIEAWEAGHPARIEGERKIAELEDLAEHSGDPRGTLGINHS
jgi:3-isopropylmalate dehydratase, small subunit